MLLQDTEGKSINGGQTVVIGQKENIQSTFTDFMNRDREARHSCAFFRKRKDDWLHEPEQGRS